MAVYVSNQVPEVVIGDPGRFRQIITNLVGNSIKVSCSFPLPHKNKKKLMGKKFFCLRLFKKKKIHLTHILIVYASCGLSFCWTVLSMHFHMLNLCYTSNQIIIFRTVYYIQSCIVKSCDWLHSLWFANLYKFKLQFTHGKGHIFVSVHVADEVRGTPVNMDEVLRQGLCLAQDMSDGTYNTLSGIPVVDRWKSWEYFKKLGSTNSMEESEMIMLLVTVEDTGVGIPLKAQSSIFTPFMQADSSTSRTHGGTGIGLSISERLVHLMGGEIGFVSKPGTGSTFSFTGALKKGEATSLDTKWQQCDLAVSEFQGLRALVIDKSSIRAEVTRYHLQRLGITVDIAFSLKSACSYLSSACKTRYILLC